MISRNERRSLKKIQRQRLYIGSGVDDIYDSNLKTYLDDFGQYHPDYTDAKKQAVSEIVYNSDFSKNEDEISKSLYAKVNGIKYDKIIGHYIDNYVGFVRQDEYRKKGSSGGMVSWVATKLFESGEIDGLIHVKKSNKPGQLFEYVISRSVSGIKSGAKSRYYPVELSTVLKEVIDTPGKYAVVGIPEIITELRLLSEKNKTIKDRIIFYFGLVAGHQKTTKYAEALAWEYGIEPGNLQDIDFRVKRDSGRASDYDTMIKGRVNGETNTFTIPGTEPFISSWAHGFFKAKFSDFTDNTFNEVSDITFGDAWLKEYVEDPAGNNILIVRHPVIARLIKKGIKDGELSLDPVDEQTIVKSQMGLVHHTKDELSYRLHKEKKIFGWSPLKRVTPSDTLQEKRKKVQDARQKIALLSSVYYKKAVKKNDFSYFRKKMQVYTDRYDRLYGQNRPNGHKKVKADGAILTLPGYYNYGNVLQRYALQKFLRDNSLNYVSYIHSKVRNQNTIYKHLLSVYLKAPLRFIKRLTRRQKPYWYFPNLSDKNKEIKNEINLVNFVNKYVKVKNFDPRDTYKTYIVGSDQVWRKWRNDTSMLGYYFLNFTRNRKVKRIAYAASFGKDVIDEVMSNRDVKYVEPYIKQFDAISVREDSAISMIQKTWGIKGVNSVLDPTLLIDKSNYSQLIDDSNSSDIEIPPIFAYVIDETAAISNFLDKSKKMMKKDMMKIDAHGSIAGPLPEVELWLKGYRDAELVITNSFHGMMFAIINNTDFFIIGRRDGGLSRIEDFMRAFKIKNRIIYEENLENSSLLESKPLDWEYINSKLSERRHESAEWLLSATEKNKV